MDLRLREYRKSDLDAMVTLDRMCFAPEFLFDRTSMRRFAEACNAVTVVAESEADQGKLAGFVIVHIEQMRSGRRGYLITLDVASAYRRKRLASHLVQIAEERARAAGARSMELHVYVENQAAIRLYDSAGCVREAVRPAFYGEQRDAYAYRKLITASL